MMLRQKMSPIPERRSDLPPPEDDLGSVEVNNTDGTGSEDDDDFEGADGNDGYQLLAQEPEQFADDSENAESESGASMIDSVLQQIMDSDSSMPSNNSVFTTVIPGEAHERVELWNKETKKDVEPIAAEAECAIKTAMANFTLPTQCVPDWAKHIPEEQWKLHLLTKIRDQKQSHS